MSTIHDYTYTNYTNYTHAERRIFEHGILFVKTHCQY